MRLFIQWADTGLGSQGVKKLLSFPAHCHRCIYLFFAKVSECGATGVLLLFNRLRSRIMKVCIVGAGVSGLAAAEMLVKNGINDIVILEAQNRVGGRILTLLAKSEIGAKYDLGAAWFHDSLTNPVLTRMIDDGTFDIQRDGYYDDQDEAVYDRNGRFDITATKLNRVAEEIERYIEIKYSSSLDVPDVSLKDVVGEFLEERKSFLSEIQISTAGLLLRYLELWYGISHDHISAKYAVMDHEGRNLYNRQGYGRFIETLKSQVLQCIQLNCPVKTIKRADPVVVTTGAGSEIIADYVIVTVPQSILQLPHDHEYGIKWEPPLPQPMADSLKSIHFGALGKVILEFDSVWWDDSQDRMLVLAENGSEASWPPKPFQFPIFVVNYHRVSGKPSLVVLTQSPVTDYLELNPEKAWDYMREMVSTFAVAEVTDPTNVIVTDWTLNPYERGSYSALHVGDDPNDIIVHFSGDYSSTGLGEGSRVRFAGEHTIADGSGCVHGAYMSGHRAAQWILNDMGVEKRNPSLK